jgi:hypothetical protein
VMLFVRRVSANSERARASIRSRSFTRASRARRGDRVRRSVSLAR